MNNNPNEKTVYLPMITLVEKDQMRCFIDQETGEVFANASTISLIVSHPDILDIWEWTVLNDLRPQKVEVMTRHCPKASCYLFNESQIALIYQQYNHREDEVIDTHWIRWFIQDLLMDSSHKDN